LTAGIAAGLVSWLGGELTHGLFQPSLSLINFGMGVSLTMPTAVSQNVADLHNAAVAFGILGGVTGLALGLAGGLASHSLMRGVIIGFAALVVGGLVGIATSLTLIPLSYRQFVPDTNDLYTAILIRGGIWTAIALVGGLAFASGLGCPRRIPHVLVDVCVGALLATVVFQLLSAVLFADSRSTDPIANSVFVRLLAMLMIPVVVAIGAARGVMGRAT
jgi:hypothetical protein